VTSIDVDEINTQFQNIIPLRGGHLFSTQRRQGAKTQRGLSESGIGIQGNWNNGLRRWWPLSFAGMESKSSRSPT
jgi:hypothetical protein